MLDVPLGDTKRALLARPGVVFDRRGTPHTEQLHTIDQLRRAHLEDAGAAGARFTDVVLCFPTFFLILTVIALLPPSIYNIMIVIGVTSWMGTARFVRAEFLSLRSR